MFEAPKGLRIVALAGGVGGAKLADGLARILDPVSLTIVVNTGDDFWHLGLRISPDLDTVCYTLAGIASPKTGWGQAGDSWAAIEAVAALGGPDWFRLGDKDLGTSLERTRLLSEGKTLSEITRRFCSTWEVLPAVLPMSDDECPTIVVTDQGELEFQDYFVRLRCEPRVSGFRLDRAQAASPASGIIAAIDAADLVIICPSNPWVSVDPILAVPGVRQAVARRTVVAVSPIIGGQAVKGPAAKMYRELGIEPSPLSVASHYRSLLDGMVMDRVDGRLQPAVADLGLAVLVTDTLMKSLKDRTQLSQDTLEFGLGVNQ
ncbi:MAG: 2-phospho-L-lactate transferase [Anaerolineales bacterium]|nr:2-phospho-L-lactate transferase [Anaerolineales bacterium]